MLPAIAAWTLILYLPSPHGAYVTADSRADGGDPALKDQAKKIFLCGRNAVCAISGGLQFSVTVPGPGDSLQKGAVLDVSGLIARLSPNAPDTGVADWLAAEMTGPIEQFWNEWMTPHRFAQPMTARLGEPVLCTLVVTEKGSSSGPARLHQIQFRFSAYPDREAGWRHELLKPAVVELDGARPLAQGVTQCLRIRPDQAPAVETRAELLSTVRELYARSQLGLACGAVIGGPVRIARIGEEGAQWVQDPESAVPTNQAIATTTAIEQ